MGSGFGSVVLSAMNNDALASHPHSWNTCARVSRRIEQVLPCGYY